MTELWSQIAQWLSVWYTTRSAGLTAFLLLSLAVVAGIMQAWRLLPAPWRDLVSSLHKGAAWIGLLFGAAHGLVLLFDQYVGYSLADILIPFHSSKQSWPLAIGILSFYSWLILQFTVDWLRNLNAALWKAVHWLSFPAYLLALWHGIAMGSDAANPSVYLIYLLSIGAVSLTLVIRATLVLFAEKSPAPSKASTK